MIRKAQTEQYKLIILIMVILVVIVVVWAFFHFNLGKYFDWILPTMNDTDKNTPGGVVTANKPEFVFQEGDYRVSVKLVDWNAANPEDTVTFWFWFDPAENKLKFKVGIKNEEKVSDWYDQISDSNIFVKLLNEEQKNALISVKNQVNLPSPSQENLFQVISSLSSYPDYYIDFQVLRDRYYGKNGIEDSLLGRKLVKQNLSPEQVEKYWNTMNTKYRYIKCAGEETKKC